MSTTLGRDLSQACFDDDCGSCGWAGCEHRCHNGQWFNHIASTWHAEPAPTPDLAQTVREFADEWLPRVQALGDRLNAEVAERKQSKAKS